MSEELKVWIIGAGAIAEQYHIPAILKVEGIAVHGIVDVNPERLNQVSSKYGIQHCLQDYREIDRDVCDLVMVCVPPGLQAKVVSHFLKQSVHVFVEKPGSVSRDEFNALLDLSIANDCSFSVGVFRRLYPSTQMVKRLIKSRTYGALKRVSFEEGYFYGWLNESAYIFNKKMAGGGVLLDTGAHTLDRVLYCTRASAFEKLSYSDNQKGGVESECELSFGLRSDILGDDVIPVSGKLSRLRELSNEFCFEFERAIVKCGTNTPNEISIQMLEVGQDSAVPTICSDPTKSNSIDDYFTKQITNQVNVLSLKDDNVQAAASILLNFELYTACYEQRQDLNFNWDSIPEELLR